MTVNLRTDPQNPPFLSCSLACQLITSPQNPPSPTTQSSPLPSGRQIHRHSNPHHRPVAGRRHTPRRFPWIRPAISVQERQRGTQPARSDPIRQVKGKKREVKSSRRVTAAAAASILTCARERGKPRKPRQGRKPVGIAHSQDQMFITNT